MPPKLNLANMRIAAVEEDVFDAVIEIWKARFLEVRHIIDTNPPARRDFVKQQHAPRQARLAQLIRNANGLQERERTSLRALRYERFWVVHHPTGRYLAGLTGPITMTDDRRRAFQAPRFTVYLPFALVKNGLAAPFHFVPEGHETGCFRTVHHRAYTSFYAPGSDEIVDLSEREHWGPLDMQPSTCWGDFGPVITSGCEAADVIDLFRTLRVYLERINLSSPLVPPQLVPYLRGCN